MKGTPEIIETSYSYMSILPEDVINKANELKLSKEYHMYWIARLALMFPLPPCWFTKTLEKSKKYINPEYGIELRQHPAQIFIN